MTLSVTRCTYFSLLPLLIEPIRLIRDDRLKIVRAYYDINTGKVRFLT